MGEVLLGRQGAQAGVALGSGIILLYLLLAGRKLLLQKPLIIGGTVAPPVQQVVCHVVHHPEFSSMPASCLLPALHRILALELVAFQP